MEVLYQLSYSPVEISDLFEIESLAAPDSTADTHWSVLPGSPYGCGVYAGLAHTAALIGADTARQRTAAHQHASADALRSVVVVVEECAELGGQLVASRDL